MADKILIKGGNLANMPSLSEREIVVATDEKALYVGINGQKVRMCGAGDKAELDKKLTATAAEAQATLEATTDLAGTISAFNSLISALKAGGIMKEG